MKGIPFSVYDVFAYLASGAVVLLGLDSAFGVPVLIGKEHTAAEGTLLVLAAFVAGQIVAEASQALLEDVGVHRLLGAPSIRLMADRAGLVSRLLLPRYVTPLPELVRRRIVERATNEGAPSNGEALFVHVRFHRVTLDDAALLTRLSIFLVQYGSARNLSMASAIAAALFLVGARRTHEEDFATYAALAAFVAIAMFYRYLKFFRQYSYELLNCYGATRR